jgi:hypothetical protein
MRFNPLILILGIALVASLAFGGYYFYQFQQSKNTDNTEELNALIEEIGHVYELPTGETPALATVTDAETVKSQPFFGNAQNGDKVLIYTQAQKAILYRPSTKKIINVAPIQNIAAEPTSSPVAEQADPVPEIVSIALYNGTFDTNVAANVQSQVSSGITDHTVEFPIITEATQKPYQTSVVVNVSGTYTAQADQIASLLGTQVQELPSNEAVPNTDLLIIIGLDQL